jgi:hypothetical protein
MASKIRIKMGPLEVDYEGSEEFLKQELPDLLSSLSTLYKESGVSHEGMPGNNGRDTSDGGGSGIEGTTATLAAKLNVKTGPELIVAACAHLTFVKGSEAFMRTQIYDECKSATAYFSENIRKNFSSYLKNLVKAGKLIERSKDTYALQADARKALETQLA